MKALSPIYKALTLVIILVTLVFLFIDFYTWWLYPVIGFDKELLAWSAALRFARTCLAGVFILPILQDSSLLKGNKLLATALIVAIIADYFLILEAKLIIGIAIFGIMQILLIIRHLIGVNTSILKQKRQWVFYSLAFTISAIILLMLYTPLTNKGMFLPVAFYALLLIISLGVAYTSKAIKVLPHKQANFAFWGMVLFVLCDITVGIGAAFGTTNLGIFIRSTTGVFYTPALLLLALSGMVAMKQTT